MRVFLAISRGDEIGGAQIYVESMANGLLQCGHQVLVATGTPGIFSERLQRSGIRTAEIPSLIRAVKPWNDLRAISQLKREVRNFAPDVVFLHSTKAGLLGRLAGWNLGVPAVLTAHGWAFQEGVPNSRRVAAKYSERWMAHFLAKIICVSDFDRRLAIRAGIPAEKLVVIHNGVHDVAAPDRAVLASESSQVIITMIARFAPQKDHSTVLRSVQHLSNVTLQFVGDGPLRSSAEQLAQQLGIDNRVQFMGFSDDVSDILRKSDIFVLMSRYEGLPLATIEAMRAGIPTVVSNTGGSPEAVEDGKTGFVVPRGDFSTLGSALDLLANDVPLRHRMGVAARKKYETEFTFDRMYQRTVDALSSVALR